MSIIDDYRIHNCDETSGEIDIFGSYSDQFSWIFNHRDGLFSMELLDTINFIQCKFILSSSLVRVSELTLSAVFFPTRFKLEIMELSLVSRMSHSISVYLLPIFSLQFISIAISFTEESK